jgi:4-alpha-glucanotransferase
MRHGDVRREYEEFCLGQASWLEDYALFRALKARYGGAYYVEWPTELVLRCRGALAAARRNSETVSTGSGSSSFWCPAG